MDIPSLPAKPNHFECQYAGKNWMPDIDCPARMPRTAKHVATVEWTWTPWHNYEFSYHLSTNISRTHWILWWGYYDDIVTCKWVHIPYAYGPRKGVLPKVAAIYLMIEGLRGQQAEDEDSISDFHIIKRTGLVSEEELWSIESLVWPEDEDKKG